MNKILIVDDDQELSSMLADYLGAEGLQVSQATDGAQGVDALLKGEADLVVMDIMMPVMDGLEALREIRRHSSVPVIMLTAKGDDVDRIIGLEIGADDYLSKPFNPRELLARIKAVLRRTDTSSTKPAITIDTLNIDSASRAATINRSKLELTSTEFNLLYLLAENAGLPITKKLLSEKALGRKLKPYERSIDMHMSNLRRKLAAHDAEHLLTTIRGLGYQLTPQRKSH